MAFSVDAASKLVGDVIQVEIDRVEAAIALMELQPELTLHEAYMKSEQPSVLPSIKDVRVLLSEIRDWT